MEVSTELYSVSMDLCKYLWTIESTAGDQEAIGFLWKVGNSFRMLIDFFPNGRNSG